MVLTLSVHFVVIWSHGDVCKDRLIVPCLLEVHEVAVVVFCEMSIDHGFVCGKLRLRCDKKHKVVS